MIARTFRRLAAVLLLALFGWCVSSIAGPVDTRHGPLAVRMR